MTASHPSEQIRSRIQLSLEGLRPRGCKTHSAMLVSPRFLVRPNVPGGGDSVRCDVIISTAEAGTASSGSEPWIGQKTAPFSTLRFIIRRLKDAQWAKLSHSADCCVLFDDRRLFRISSQRRSMF